MKWLSIDIGKYIGWALWNDNLLVESGSCNFTQFSNFKERLQHIINYTHILFGDNKPKFIVMESLEGNVDPWKIYSMNQQNRIWGAIFTVASYNGAEVFEINQKIVKKQATGYGSADKKMMKEVVRGKYGKENGKNEHQADAVGIGMAMLRLTCDLTMLDELRNIKEVEE